MFLQTTAESIRSNRERISSRIADAAKRSGREPDAVRLMAVTKTQPRELVELALESGLTLFGENRVQEALEKYRRLRGRVELHLIGHLQRNKAKSAAGFFDCVQSVDKASTARELNKRAEAEGAEMRVLVEVNTSGEESKFGVRGDEALWALLDVLGGLDSLSPQGLMTIGPFTSDEGRIRRAFSSLRSLFEQARQRFPELSLDTLSMGMSNDYAIAVEEGSTLVRIGTALFGPRPAGASEPAEPAEPAG